MKAEYIPIGLLGLFLIGAFTHVQDVAAQNKYMAGIRLQIVNVTINKDNSISIVFRFQNPNSKPITIRSIVGDFFVNNRKIGNVGTFQEKILNGNAETLYTVNIRVKTIALIYYITDLFKMRNPAVNTTFKGTININNSAIPVLVNYVIKL